MGAASWLAWSGLTRTSLSSRQCQLQCRPRPIGWGTGSMSALWGKSDLRVGRRGIRTGTLILAASCAIPCDAAAAAGTVYTTPILG
jgi:hypothetical protein